VIADVVNYAIAGIGFIHAVGRLFVSKGFTASFCERLRSSGVLLSNPLIDSNLKDRLWRKAAIHTQAAYGDG
jgi:hypothetical protein